MGADPALAEVREKYRAGDLVLFVGAGVSAAAGLPSWAGLVAQLVARVKARGKPVDEIERLLEKDRFIDAITAAADAVGEPELIAVVKDALDDRRLVREVPEIGKAIAALTPRLRLALTTNLDHLLERALGWPALHDATASAGQERRVVLKLHGTLLDARTWVLTRRQYDGALYNNPALQDLLSALFRTCTLLFVGYGLADDDFDQLLARVRALSGGSPPRHFALALGAQVGSYWRREREEAGLRIVPYQAHSDVPGILRWLAAEEERPATPPAGAEGVAMFTAASVSVPAPASPAPRPFMIPGLKLARSLQRLDTLERVRDAFEHATPPRVVCLHGLTALGKTRLAIQYAHRYRERYQALFLLCAHDEHRLREGLYKMATRGLGLRLHDPLSQAEGVEAARRWLDTHDDWLLILDDAKDPAFVSRNLPAGTGDILITARDDMLRMEPMPDATIEVRGLRPAEALAYFRERSGRELSPAEERAALGIAEELGFLPEALEHAAAFVMRGRMSFDAYLERLLARPRESLLPALDLCVTCAEREGGAAADLLHLAALLDGRRIPLDLFARGALRPVESLAGIRSRFELYEVLEPLAGYALVSVDQASNSFSMNRMVQRTLRLRMDDATQRDWAARAVSVVSSSLGSLEYKDWPAHKDLAPQVRAADALIGRWDIRTVLAARLLSQAGFYLIEQGRYHDALKRYAQALSILDETVPAAEADRRGHRLDRASAVNGLGRGSYHLGRYPEAEAHFVEALAERREEAGEEHTDTATSLNNLALLYYHMDPLREGVEAMFREALRIRETHLGGEHPLVAKTMNNLALYLTFRGRLDEAGPLHERALDLRRRVLGSDHPDVAQSLSGLAQVDRARGAFDQAEPRYLEARRILEEAYGKDHPNIGFILLGLARMYMMQGRDAEARPCYEEAQRLWSPLGERHPCIARCLLGLGVLEERRGRREAAIASYRRALEIWKGTLSAGHPDEAACRRRLARLSEPEAPLST